MEQVSLTQDPYCPRALIPWIHVWISGFQTAFPQVP